MRLNLFALELLDLLLDSRELGVDSAFETADICHDATSSTRVGGISTSLRYRRTNANAINGMPRMAVLSLLATAADYPRPPSANQISPGKPLASSWALGTSPKNISR